MNSASAATTSSTSYGDARQQGDDSEYPLKKDIEEKTETPEDPREKSEGEGIALPYNLMKALRRKSSSVIGSVSSTGGGSGNNSDNSGLVSIGNNSFGFNFDTEEGMNSSGQNSEGDGKTNDSDSDGNGRPDDKSPPPPDSVELSTETKEKSTSSSSGATSKETTSRGWKSSVSSLTQASVSDSNVGSSLSHKAAAAANVANLQSIASAFEQKGDDEAEPEKKPSPVPSAAPSTRKTKGRKRPAATSDNDSGGYNSEADESTPPNQTAAARSRKKAKTKLDDSKREERNAREKERSFRISKQINELRNLLSSGGVIVPKGTKSSVLTEAANYIRMLQQHQYKSEIDRHQLVQQMQVIGAGALGPQASVAVRHVAAQNGVWSLGNFGGVPPKSAMTYYPQVTTSAAPEQQQQQSSDGDTPMTATVNEHDYRFVFNSSPVGMAIASMGGAFIDCNQLFCQLSNYTKQEVCSMTIFNMTSRQDLQHAFDLISQMISPSSADAQQHKPKPCVLRGSMKERNDLGLSVALIRGDDGIAKCFCITLIKNPASPFDTSRPIPATSDFIIPSPTAKNAAGPLNSSPAYTAG